MISRKKFLKNSFNLAVLNGVFPSIIPASALGKEGNVSPNERITLGFIGTGLRANAHIKNFLHQEDAQIVALSDTFDSKLMKMQKTVEKHYSKGNGSYKGCDTYKDFRELLARKDIDAVVIATPQHWHGLHMKMAAEAGKDIYGEKALTRTVAEGRVVCDTVKKHGTVFQVGTQQRSSRNFRFACELVRNGYIGKLKAVTVAVPGGSSVPDSPVAPVPKEFDYNMWLGPAPFQPYCDLRVHYPGYKKHTWYHQYDYCVGFINAWGVHHLDIAIWGCPDLLKSPLQVDGTGVFPESGIGNTSLTWNVNFLTTTGIKVEFTDKSANTQGCKFEGDKGWVHVNRQRIQTEPKSLIRVKLKENEEHLYKSVHHWQNFLECVYSRKTPASAVESGHQATTLGNIADIATRIKGKLKWDWDKEEFLNNDKANQMLSRPMRNPWKI